MTNHNSEQRMPNLDEAIRFMRSNPLTSWETMLEILDLGNEDNAPVSGGRFRELWKLSGGAFDRKGCAWVEIETLPVVLRRLIDAVNKIDGVSPSNPDNIQEGGK